MKTVSVAPRDGLLRLFRSRIRGAAAVLGDKRDVDRFEGAPTGDPVDGDEARPPAQLVPCTAEHGPTMRGL